jgi:hypothetical protein
MRRLKTSRDVIDALGGIEAVSKLTGRGIPAVYAWLPPKHDEDRSRRGKFPPNTYRKLTTALAAKNATAPDYLWRMDEAPASKSEGAAA